MRVAALVAVLLAAAAVVWSRPGEGEWAAAAAGAHPCNVPTVDAGAHSVEALAADVRRADRAATPLLLRRAMLAWPAFAAWRRRADFLRAYGQMHVGVGVGFRISARPNRDGLFHSWIGPGAGASAAERDEARALRRRFEAQARAGTAPSLAVAELAARVRNGSLPHDAYSFAPVDGTALANVSELHRLWRLLPHAHDDGHVAGTLFGLGGRGSGVMFHSHTPAVSALFAGHKRWLLYDDAAHGPDRAFLRAQLARATRRDPGFRLHSMAAWVEHVLPLPDVRAWWARAGWDCVQRAGDLLYVPGQLHHGTLNLDEAVSLSIQASKTLAPRRPVGEAKKIPARPDKTK